MNKKRYEIFFLIITLVFISFILGCGKPIEIDIEKITVKKGVCAIVGMPENRSESIIKLAKQSNLLIFFQTPDAKDILEMRKAAEAAGLLGKQIFVGQGALNKIHLADNLADVVFIEKSANKKEVLRVLRPGGKAFWGQNEIIKSVPKNLDDWSHPYHGPDNNPLSTDKVARYPFLTQFLGYPLFGCIPEVTVASNGKIFKAFGNIAFKIAQNEVLNKLYGINGYNGEILWTRPLNKNFMIHRNTIIATPEILYLGDNQSCKMIDTKTGKIENEITPPREIAEGTTWKWMALEGNILYALIGEEETRISVKRGKQHGFGGWPWGMWQGYDYKGGAKAFGFGRNFVAINPKTKKILWHYREKELLDSRGICMKNNRIYYYSPGKFLGCLNAETGRPVWKTSDPSLLQVIGPSQKAQHYITGFSTTTYIKCNKKYIFFAGSQRPNLVVVSTKDGQLIWHKKNGNFHLILRNEALYAVGSNKRKSFKYDYDTGKILDTFSGRRGCTRATGSMYSIFYRAPGGTIRYMPTSNTIEHIAPMRPPCQDGVIISNGMLHWGPWICGCPLSLYGNIGLAPAGNFNFHKKYDKETQLEKGDGNLVDITSLKGDIKKEKKATICGKIIFTTGDDGIIKAINKENKNLIWKAYTGGGIKYAPAIWQGRTYVGSNDGWVYAFEAATGRLLWRFRAAPLERRIPVYGKLMSTWPVAGGVVVSNGVVYAAAGITHYDGTYVYALDAITGEVRWQNNSSGSISKYNNGISLQGKLRIEEGKLTFCGGNAYPEAAFDLKTGKCLTNASGPYGQKPSTFYAVSSYLEKIRQYEINLAMEKIKNPSFIKRLKADLKNKNNDIRFEAIEEVKWLIPFDETKALKKWAVPYLVERLKKDFKNKDDNIHSETIQQLRWLITLDETKAFKKWTVSYFTKRLKKNLKSKDDNIHSKTIQRLRWLITLDETKALKKWAIPYLVERLSVEGEARWKAGEALGKIKAGEIKKIFPLLLNMLETNNDDMTQQAVIYALGSMKKKAKEAKHILIKILLDNKKPYATRETAVWALRNIAGVNDKKIIRALKKMTKDKDKEIRDAAEKTLIQKTH
jgi:outer membrane protein assembly factor BamB